MKYHIRTFCAAALLGPLLSSGYAQQSDPQQAGASRVWDGRDPILDLLAQGILLAGGLKQKDSLEGKIPYPEEWGGQRANNTVGPWTGAERRAQIR